MNLEVTILSNLIYNERYTRKVLPFIRQDYFTAREHRIIFLEIHGMSVSMMRYRLSTQLV